MAQNFDLSTLIEKVNEVQEEKKPDIEKMIADLEDAYGGSNEDQGKMVQLLRGLAFSDAPKANQFMKKLDKATTEIAAEMKAIKDESTDLDEAYRGKYAAYDPNTGKLEKVFKNKKEAEKWVERQHDPSMADPKYKKMGKDVETDIRPYKESVDLDEASDMNANDLAKELQKTFEKYFPKSMVVSKFTRNLASSISVEFTLGNGKSEYTNGNKNNDPMHHLMFVWMSGSSEKDETITGPLELNVSLGKYIRVDESKAGTNRGIVKVPFRKTTGDSSSILKGFEKYIKRLKETVTQYQESIKAPFDVSKKL